MATVGVKGLNWLIPQLVVFHISLAVISCSTHHSDCFCEGCSVQSVLKVFP